MLIAAATCNDASLAGIMSAVKRILLIIQILVPILLVVSASYGFFQMMGDPDKKNGGKSIINKFIAAIVVFFIPMFIDVTMGVVGEKTKVSDCWNKAGEKVSAGSSYQDENDEGPKPKQVISSGDYEKGTGTSTTEDNN